jgi:hypothetical protein
MNTLLLAAGMVYLFILLLAGYLQLFMILIISRQRELLIIGCCMITDGWYDNAIAWQRNEPSGRTITHYFAMGYTVW